MRLSHAAPTLLLAALGCNNYDIYSVAGYEQVSFSNDAEVVFIIDNSSSMQDEAEALAQNFNVFIDQLTNTEDGSGLQTDDLSDAVQNYIVYTTERGRYLDYQLAITTTSVAIPDNNPNLPGTYGALTGDPDIVSDTDANVETSFITNLFCDATCWNAAVLPSDPNATCEGGPSGDVTLEYLDCLCGFEEWEGNCGSGTEEPLEAAFMAMCRAVPNPPDACFDFETPFTEADVGSNAGLVRDGSTVIFVVVTDEGDYSRRLGQGDVDPEPYLELLDLFRVRYRFAVIGPNYDHENARLTCNSGGATTWASRRLQLAAEATNGFYRPIAEEGAGSDCVASDFAQHLEDLGALLQGLEQSFPLQSYPDVSTIAVYVNGEYVPQATLDEAATEATGEEVYGSGWIYDASENAISFQGDAVPDYNADVDIFYKPLEGMPRELPF
ncbi:MAG: hypothetical protein H6741_07890 [Alphaproteobacteria bacterium]|nr:hypothetical protein [Alphaproteobacteria bacterium]